MATVRISPRHYLEDRFRSKPVSSTSATLAISPGINSTATMKSDPVVDICNNLTAEDTTIVTSATTTGLFLIPRTSSPIPRKMYDTIPEASENPKNRLVDNTTTERDNFVKEDEVDVSRLDKNCGIACQEHIIEIPMADEAASLLPISSGLLNLKKPSHDHSDQIGDAEQFSTVHDDAQPEHAPHQFSTMNLNNSIDQNLERKAEWSDRGKMLTDSEKFPSRIGDVGNIKHSIAPSAVSSIKAGSHVSKMSKLRQYLQGRGGHKGGKENMMPLTSRVSMNTRPDCSVVIETGGTELKVTDSKLHKRCRSDPSDSTAELSHPIKKSSKHATSSASHKPFVTDPTIKSMRNNSADNRGGVPGSPEFDVNCVGKLHASGEKLAAWSKRSRSVLSTVVAPGVRVHVLPQISACGKGNAELTNIGECKVNDEPKYNADGNCINRRKVFCTASIERDGHCVDQNAKIPRRCSSACTQSDQIHDNVEQWLADSDGRKRVRNVRSHIRERESKKEPRASSALSERESIREKINAPVLNKHLSGAAGGKRHSSTSESSDIPAGITRHYHHHRADLPRFEHRCRKRAHNCAAAIPSTPMTSTLMLPASRDHEARNSPAKLNASLLQFVAEVIESLEAAKDAGNSETSTWSHGVDRGGVRTPVSVCKGVGTLHEGGGTFRGVQNAGKISDVPGVPKIVLSSCYSDRNQEDLQEDVDRRYVTTDITNTVTDSTARGKDVNPQGMEFVLGETGSSSLVSKATNRLQTALDNLQSNLRQTVQLDNIQQLQQQLEQQSQQQSGQRNRDNNSYAGVSTRSVANEEQSGELFRISPFPAFIDRPLAKTSATPPHQVFERKQSLSAEEISPGPPTEHSQQDDVDRHFASFPYSSSSVQRLKKRLLESVEAGRGSTLAAGLRGKGNGPLEAGRRSTLIPGRRGEDHELVEAGRGSTLTPAVQGEGHQLAEADRGSTLTSQCGKGHGSLESQITITETGPAGGGGQTPSTDQTAGQSHDVINPSRKENTQRTLTDSTRHTVEFYTGGVRIHLHDKEIVYDVEKNPDPTAILQGEQKRLTCELSEERLKRRIAEESCKPHPTFV